MLNSPWLKRFTIVTLVTLLLLFGIPKVVAQLTTTKPRPKVILISLDGATPRLVQEYLSKGILSPKRGLGLLMSQGIVAKQNITCSASLTAACHIAIATGSTAAMNNINSNNFHLVVSPFNENINGFEHPLAATVLKIALPFPVQTPQPNQYGLDCVKMGKKLSLLPSQEQMLLISPSPV